MTDRVRLLWHSNAPWAPTGYGAQSALFAPRLAEHYNLRISAFYGLEAAPMVWEDIPVLPSYGGTYGAESLPLHAMKFFDGDPHGGITFTLMDVWVLPPQQLSQFDLVCWTPVDHDPVPPGVSGFLAHSHAIPVAMSRFGEEQLKTAGLEPLYCPHAVDTSVLKPMGRELARKRAGIGDDRFMVGVVAANKGNPSRKNLVAILEAFAEFQRRHEEAFLYLHTDLTGETSQGVFLPAVIESLGIPDHAIAHPDPYTMHFQPHRPDQMALLYSAMDVLLNPASGGGFEIPLIEAQACGVPVITTDFTAMPELVGAGWTVNGARMWTGQRSWQMLPYVREIVDALEDCHGLSGKDRDALSLKAREFALGYDIETVMHDHMLPVLEEAQERFRTRKPATAEARRWSVSIITPWRDHPEFMDDYRTAVETVSPTEVLVIDDGSKVPIDSAAHRFEEPVGFSRACNKGLELATGDVVIFLNNDIRMIRADWLDMILQAVEPGVIVGPQMRNDAHTIVDGHVIPYLDGWCLACMREDFHALGAWDTTYHDPPYFGDNDLCLRAKTAGMELREVRFGLEHLLNGTSDDDPAGRMEVTLANRRIYEQRVRALLARSEEKAGAAA